MHDNKRFWSLLIALLLGIFIQNALPLHSSELNKDTVYEQSIIEQNIENGFEAPLNIWNINTAEDDFAPCFISTTKEFYHNSIVNGYSKYYVSNLQMDLAPSNNTYYNLEFQKTRLLNSPINQPLKNRAYFSVVNQENYSQTLPNDVKYALVNASAYHSTGNYVNIQRVTFERNTWSQPITIPELSGDCFIGHPAISKTGEQLIFSSNKNSNNQTTDIWMARINNENMWDMMTSIDELNSIGNEITPCYVTENLLIFSSDGFDGKGGYDLYYSTYSQGKWSKPIPLEDLNTEFNESDPMIIEGKYLVFASDRPSGKGKLDLYLTKLKTSIHSEDIIYNFSISATSYSLDITNKVEYDIVSASALKSDNSLVSEQVSTISLPKNIEFEVKGDSTIFNQTIDYTIRTSEKILYSNSILYKADNDKNSWIIDFSQLAEAIFHSDSIWLEASINQNIITILPFELSKSEKRELKKHENKNRQFYRAVASYNNNIDKFLENNEDIISSVKELTNYAKEIDIEMIKSDKLFKEIKDYINLSVPIKLIEVSANKGVILFKIWIK